MHKYFFLSLPIVISLSGADNQRPPSFEDVFKVLIDPANGYFYRREVKPRYRLVLNSPDGKPTRTPIGWKESWFLKDDFTEDDVERHKRQFLNRLSENDALALLYMNKATHQTWSPYLSENRAAQMAKLEHLMQQPGDIVVRSIVYSPSGKSAVGIDTNGQIFQFRQ